MAANDNTAKKSPTFQEFIKAFSPLESENLYVLTDHRTGAQYCECHIKGSKLIGLATTDVPLDPDDQSDYRANRELVENAPAFARMIDDANARRSFSNVVAEYTVEFDDEHPLKIIGGQHRYQAVKVALGHNVDEYHGIKVYFDLTMDQRLDVQLISNTNIAISGDLFDRMHETVMGPELRDWAQKVGLLGEGQDFADRRQRGGPVSVQLARSFIANYFAGKKIDPKKFDVTETVPDLCATGQRDQEWEDLRKKSPNLWKDQGLVRAGKEFAALSKAQRAAFSSAKGKVQPDYPEKSMNPAILVSWAYVAGMLHGHDNRLKRHYGLSETKGRDPLNAAALANGRHKTDPQNYRGLGYRTDAKERGRLTELFYIQTEKGDGITKSNVEVAIAKFHAKQAALEVEKLKAKGTSGG